MTLHRRIAKKIQSFLNDKFEKRRIVRALSELDRKKIIVGSNKKIDYPGWINTDKNTLDITKDKDWRYYFDDGSVDNVLAEHVFEHLNFDDGIMAFKNIFKYLKKGGVLRIAVPDGYHPSKYVRDLVEPGGLEPGADDHKTFYNIAMIKEIAQTVGFVLQPIEYFDQDGLFHSTEYGFDNGYIKRCSKNYQGRFTDSQDEYEKMINSIPENLRNQFYKNNISYTSLLVDLKK